ncbi:AraC-like DNA-binding protein [Alteromonadaceae bacterium 2753L.S.0a.02]|nr:AraC-like DNA-binding protein [Alteromonadaceae bacterium 2753L.S.0a.02]
MLKFYKKAFALLIVLTVVSALLALFCVSSTFTRSPLLPNKDSAYPWRVAMDSDVVQGGDSQIHLNDNRFSLNFNFTITNKARYPYTALALVFADTEDTKHYLDLSSYNYLSFSVKCVPANVLTLAIFTVDEMVTEPGNISTFRIPSAYFSCDESWQEVEIDLTRLETPQWWLTLFDLQLSHKEYQLTQVPRFTFGNSYQSPVDIDSNVQIDELVLHGTNWRYLYAFGAVMLILWTAFAVWVVKQHTKSMVATLREKLQKDRPLIAYQQLSLKPQRNKEKDSILRFMATEYANPDLNLDTAVASLAVNRTKLNDILKEELGYTFVAYLNKLRLTEAARLLNEKEDVNITEVAYSVGYKNVSYFNKLFKNEYGCTPKTFKASYRSQGVD